MTRLVLPIPGWKKHIPVILKAVTHLVDGFFMFVNGLSSFKVHSMNLRAHQLIFNSIRYPPSNYRCPWLRLR